MNQMTIYPPRALLVWLAAVVVACLMTLVGAKPAWAADRSFVPAPNSPVPVGSTPTTVTNADFNGDGKMDLAAQNNGSTSNSVSVRLGNGDGTFQAKPDVAVGFGPSSVISKDLNSDGIADLAVANQNSNNVSVLLGEDLNSDGKGDGTFKQKQDFAVGSNPTSVISADFNGDPYADLAVANYSANNVSVLLGQDLDGDNKADGTFRAKQDFSIATKTCNDFICIWDTEAPNQVISADFNGDNKADLATANLGSCVIYCSGPGGVSVLLGKGDGTFQTYRLVKTNATNSSVPSIAAVDFNASGSLDLVATEYNSNVVTLLRGNGDGTFQTEHNLPAGSNPSAVTSADLDGDTKADDLAVSNYGSNDVSVLFNNDSGGFQAARNFPAGNGPAFVIGADFNADSFADLAVANQNSNNVSVLLNTTVKTAPAAPVISSPPEGGRVGSSFTVSGTAEPNSTVQLSEGTASKGSATASSTGTWSILLSGITEGSHTYTAKATDTAGNSSAESNPRTVTVDTTAPTVVSTLPKAGATGVAATTNVKATFSEEMKASSIISPATTFKLVKLNTSGTTRVGAAVSYAAATKQAILDPANDLSPGTYKATVTSGAQDLAGNNLDQKPNIAGNQSKSWKFTVQ